MADSTAGMARELCDTIVNQIRKSQLHFILTETPFSVNIALRKRFTKDFIPNSSFKVQKSEPDLSSVTHHNSALHDENEGLKMEVERLKNERFSLVDTIAILEDKTAKAESELLKNFKEIRTLEKEVEDTKVLKSVIKERNNDLSRNKEEINALKKTIKSKTKEIHNMENKELNYQDTVKKLKDEIKVRKAEDIKAGKELKKAKNEIKVMKTSQVKAEKEPQKAQTASHVEAENKDNNGNFNNEEASLNVISSGIKERVPPSHSNSNSPNTSTTSEPDSTTASNSKPFSSQSKPSSTTVDVSTILEPTREEKIAKFEAEKKETLKYLDDIPEEEVIFYHNDVAVFGIDWKEHAEIMQLMKDL